jgi:hypothetical protein
MSGHSAILPPEAGALHAVHPEAPKMAETKSPAEEPRRRDDRMLPGGSIEDAKRAVGMNAVDRDMLPSYGMPSEQVDYKDSPDEPPPTRPSPK